MKRFIGGIVLLFLTLGVPLGVFAQEEQAPFISSVRILGGPVFPVGETSQMFKLGGGGTFTVHHRLKRLPFLNFFVGPGMAGIPLLDQSSSVLFVDLSLGAGVEFEILPRLNFEAFVSGGGYMGYLLNPAQEGFGGLFTVGALLGYDVSGPIRLGAGLMYRNFPGLSEQLIVTANGAYRFDFSLDDPFRSSDMEWEPFYPELASYYASGMPLGRLVLTNSGDAQWRKFLVKFDVPSVSRGWTDVPSKDRIEGLESLDLALLGDFNIKENQGSGSEDIETRVEISYRYKGWPQEKILKGSLSLRKASFGNRPESVALFVSSRDPVIRDWAKSVAAHGLEVSDEINSGLMTAAALFEGLRQSDFRLDAAGEDSWPRILRADPDPETFPFPRDSLYSASGDRTESAVLFAALLEAAGFPAGLVKLGDSWWPALSLGEGVERIKAEYAHPEDLLISDGVGWAVFDMSIMDSFLSSLASGAEAVRNTGEESAPVNLRETWATYPQTGFSRDAGNLSSPVSEDLTDGIAESLDALIRWEISSRRISLEDAIASDPRDIDLLNSLGALLARYGLREEAADWFDRVLLLEDDPRALVNMANIEFLKDDLTRARTYYNQAYRVDPFNPYVLLGLARVDFEQENFGTSRDAYSKLEFVDPDLADRFEVLTGTGPEALERARQSELRRLVFWQE